MKKIQLSQEQMDKVIKLRASGMSWLRIKNETDIPRHVAKRSYEEWEKTHLADELKAVRREVALDDFRQHRQLLFAVAEDLVGLIEITSLPLPAVSSGQYLSSLFSTNRWVGETDETQKANEKTGYAPKPNQVQRWNRMLLESLQDHTRCKVRWELLDEWQAGWDGCREAVQVPKDDIYPSFEAALDIEPALKNHFKKAGGSKAMEKVVSVVLNSLWMALRAGRAGVTFQISEVVQEDKVFIRTDDGSPDTEIPWTDRESAPVLAGVLNSIVVDLYSKTDVRRITDHLDKMKGIYTELEKTLNPLVLGPIILGTRCVLCPA